MDRRGFFGALPPVAAGAALGARVAEISVPALPRGKEFLIAVTLDVRPLVSPSAKDTLVKALDAADVVQAYFAKKLPKNFVLVVMPVADQFGCNVFDCRLDSAGKISSAEEIKPLLMSAGLDKHQTGIRPLIAGGKVIGHWVEVHRDSPMDELRDLSTNGHVVAGVAEIYPENPWTIRHFNGMVDGIKFQAVHGKVFVIARTIGQSETGRLTYLDVTPLDGSTVTESLVEVEREEPLVGQTYVT